jgi:hypothetical protein
VDHRHEPICDPVRFAFSGINANDRNPKNLDGFCQHRVIAAVAIVAWRAPSPSSPARSIVLTSQVPVDRWHDIVGNPTLADAILDRIVHNALQDRTCRREHAQAAHARTLRLTPGAATGRAAAVNGASASRPVAAPNLN